MRINKIISPKNLNVGDQKEIAVEEAIQDVKFNIFNLNNRKRPSDKRRIMIVSCFSEFGCETLGALYCLPMLLRANPGYYTIVIGWHGREYFYRHLADEFWELKEEYQWLREYCRAFHHDSKNLDKVEKSVEEYGKVVPSSYLGRLAVGNICLDCKFFWGETKYVQTCKRCNSVNIQRSLFGDMDFHKTNTVIKLPAPSKLEESKKYLGNNPVGIFARNRQCYGRNLQPEFYVKLIKMLRKMGYDPIWLGEKQSTLKCPVDDVIDFAHSSESRDLELTLSIVKQCKFTVQFWTASTRLSGMMGTPYLLFESPDQIFGNGQEGFRINLMTFGEKKLIYSHFLNVYNDNQSAIDLTEKSIKEMEDNNYEDVIGMIDNTMCTKIMRETNLRKIGGK